MKSSYSAGSCIFQLFLQPSHCQSKGWIGSVSATVLGLPNAQCTVKTHSNIKRQMEYVMRYVYTCVYIYIYIHNIYVSSHSSQTARFVMSSNLWPEQKKFGNVAKAEPVHHHSECATTNHCPGMIIHLWRWVVCRIRRSRKPFEENCLEWTVFRCFVLPLFVLPLLIGHRCAEIASVKKIL